MTTTITRKIRCAVYGRKSSEEGLEQEFNSLDAQRDAGLAYIQSQRAEGWIAVPDRYEDGGFSGGTLERPALKRLLADIEAGKIDCVVVYKVDRLTRALTDFARLVDLFDAHQVTFVSVTQSFNTTTSMGRLTLNVLLSFAQYERELAGERIRDKFAASRKRGLWMGGVPPLGYDVIDRKLVVNEPEAGLVRLIFRRFLDLGSATRLVEPHHQVLDHPGRQAPPGPADRQDLRLQAAEQPGLPRRGGPQGCGPSRRARRHHRPPNLGAGAVDPGRERPRPRQPDPGRHPGAAEGPVALRVLRLGDDAQPHPPRGRLYRYYVCITAIKQGHAACPVRSLAASEAESLVLGQMRGLFRTPEIAARTLSHVNGIAVAQTDAEPPMPERDVVEALATLDAVWENLFPVEQNRLLHLLIERIDVAPDGFHLRLRADGLHSLVHELRTAPMVAA